MQIYYPMPMLSGNIGITLNTSITNLLFISRFRICEHWHIYIIKSLQYSTWFLLVEGLWSLIPDQNLQLQGIISGAFKLYFWFGSIVSVHFLVHEDQFLTVMCFHDPVGIQGQPFLTLNLVFDCIFLANDLVWHYFSLILWNNCIFQDQSLR